MSQISNGMEMYHLKYAQVFKVKTCDEQLKWLLGKRVNFPKFGIFKKVFRFFLEFD